MKKKELTETELLDKGIELEEFSDIEEVEELLKTLPASSKSYLKVYKTKPLPVGTKPQFKTEITEVHLIEDLEVHIRNLAQENDWGPGEYLIVVVSKEKDRDKRKLTRPIRVNIDYDKPIPDKKESGNFKEKLSEMKEFASSLKDISPTGNPPDLSKTLAETFNKGMDTVKDLMRETAKDDSFLLKTLAALKEAGALGNNNGSKSSSIMETLTVLKELGIIGEKKSNEDDFFNRLAQFKELGIVKTGEEDSLATITKIKTLVETLSPFMGGGTVSGGNPSPLLELIKAVGPQVPKMVEHVMGGINNITDIIKIKAGVYTPPTQQAIVKKDNPPVTIPETISTTKEENTMSSQKFLDLLYSYIKENDLTKFEEIASFVTLISGDPNFIWSIKSGTVSSQTLVNALLLYGGEKFQESLFKEKIPAYVDQFISYIKAKEFIAICDKCDKEFDFFTKEYFESSDKKCQSEDCEGTLKVKLEG